MKIRIWAPASAVLLLFGSAYAKENPPVPIPNADYGPAILCPPPPRHAHPDMPPPPPMHYHEQSGTGNPPPPAPPPQHAYGDRSGCMPSFPPPPPPPMHRNQGNTGVSR